MCGQRSKPEPAKSTSETIHSTKISCSMKYYNSPQPCISLLASWLQSWTNCCSCDIRMVLFPPAPQQWLRKMPHGLSVRSVGTFSSSLQWEGHLWDGFPREPLGAQSGAEGCRCRLASGCAHLHRYHTSLGKGKGWNQASHPIWGGKMTLVPDPPLCHWFCSVREGLRHHPFKGSQVSTNQPTTSPSFPAVKPPTWCKISGDLATGLQHIGTAIFCMCTCTRVLAVGLGRGTLHYSSVMNICHLLLKTWNLKQ